MSHNVILPEPISKNIFEEYIRLIEQIKLHIKDQKNDAYLEINLIYELVFLDNIVNGIERSLQDINSNNLVTFKDEVASTITECLTSWILSEFAKVRSRIFFQPKVL